MAVDPVRAEALRFDEKCANGEDFTSWAATPLFTPQFRRLRHYLGTACNHWADHYTRCPVYNEHDWHMPRTPHLRADPTARRAIAYWCEWGIGQERHWPRTPWTSGCSAWSGAGCSPSGSWRCYWQSKSHGAGGKSMISDCKERIDEG